MPESSVGSFILPVGPVFARCGIRRYNEELRWPLVNWLCDAELSFKVGGVHGVDGYGCSRIVFPRGCGCFRDNLHTRHPKMRRGEHVEFTDLPASKWRAMARTRHRIAK